MKTFEDIPIVGLGALEMACIEFPPPENSGAIRLCLLLSSRVSQSPFVPFQGRLHMCSKGGEQTASANPLLTVCF